MKRGWIIVAVVAVVVLGGWWGYGKYVAGQAAGPGAASSQSEAGQIEAPDLTNFVSASGTLLPVKWAGLSPAAGGTIRRVLVAEGDQVQAGTLLVELDNAVLQSEAAAAGAALSEAKAAQDKLLAGATPSELAAAGADVAAAEAGVAQAKAGLNEAQQAVAAAETQVAIAQAQYNELASHPTETERISAAREIDLAEAALRQAQSAYDKVRGDPQIGARPEALALEQATVSYNAAKAAYTAATQGATPQQLAVGQAQIKAAAAQVEVARSQVPSAEASVQSAGAQLARAQAALDRLQAGATTEEKAVAAAQVEAAQAGLSTAQAGLAQTQVVAPFAGQAGTVLARPGETATPGQALVMFGDTSSMHVETTDLRETDVTSLRTGMPVEVTFDALPGQIFNGSITRIAPMSNTDKGSTNYTVIVDVEKLDPSLRWGMTAFVNVQIR